MAAWIGPGIQAGGALLGGLLGRSSARADARRAEKRADPRAIRARFERAGFNPLLGIQGATPNPGAAQYQMSNDMLMSTIAEAGDGLGEAATLRMQLTQQEREKERLENLVDRATLGASVGGVYDAQTSTGTRLARPAPQQPPSGGSGGRAGGGGSLPAGLTPRPPSDPAWDVPTFEVPGGASSAPGGRVLETDDPSWIVETDPGATMMHDGPLMRTLTMPDGTVRQVPVGFDFDEMLTGAGIQAHDRFMDNLPQNARRSAWVTGLPFPIINELGIPQYIEEAMEAGSLDPRRDRPRPRPWGDIREWDLAHGASWSPY